MTEKPKSKMSIEGGGYLINSKSFRVYSQKGITPTTHLQTLQLETKDAKGLVGVGRTLEKGLWWQGDETDNKPKFLWGTASKKGIDLFVGRIAFSIMWAKK